MKTIVRRMLLACLLAAPLAGCNAFYAERIVAPPNSGHVRALVADEKRLPAGERELRVSVGDPPATLAVWVMEPKVPARGTILVLHGFLNDHTQLEGTARALRDAGYRAVLVDLRGHGQSTGEHISFGVLDARDLADLTTYLQEHGLCGREVGVFGASYGAATALIFAGNDPRVSAVVAVAPFATLKEEAPHFGKWVFPAFCAFLSEADYTEILQNAGHIAGFDPQACSPLAGAKKTAAHLLLVHGDLDYIIPCEASKEIAAAAGDHAQLTIKHGAGHLGLCFDVLGELHAPAREWFDRYLSQQMIAPAQANAVQ